MASVAAYLKQALGFTTISYNLLLLIQEMKSCVFDNPSFSAALKTVQVVLPGKLETRAF